MFFVFFAILLALCSAESFASFFFSIFALMVGHIFCLSIPIYARKYALKVFNITFVVYVLFALCYFLGIKLNWFEFARDGRDEYWFWVQSEHLASYPSFFAIIRDCFIDRVHIENEGFQFILGTVAYFSESYLDGNHLLLQSLGSVFWGSLLSIVMYKILLLYFEPKKSGYYALFYSLCTIVLPYSCTILRDIHIAFFYACAIYIVLKGYSVKGLLLLLLDMVVLFEFRFESGLFLSVFIAYYLYDKIKRKYLLVILLGVMGVVIFWTLFADKLLGAMESMENYSAYTDGSLTDDSLGASFYRLPSPLKEIMILINSQIQPFPSWTALSVSTNIFEGVYNFHNIIRGYFWFLVVISLLFWLLKHDVRERIPVCFKFLLLITLVFLLANTSNMTPRRIMCIYPIIFLVYVWIKEYLIDLRTVKNASSKILFLYLILVIVYLFIKYIL